MTEFLNSWTNLLGIEYVFLKSRFFWDKANTLILQILQNGLLYSQSPAHSFSSYDSGKNESMDRGAEDLSLNRGEEDEDDHDDHEDAEKANESDGVEAERLKAFNVSYIMLYAFLDLMPLFWAAVYG